MEKELVLLFEAEQSVGNLYGPGAAGRILGLTVGNHPGNEATPWGFSGDCRSFPLT